MPKKGGGQAAVISRDEMKRLLAMISVGRYAKRDRLLILFSFGLGLRAIELASLRLSHVFNEDETINVSIHLSKTKGKYRRTVYLPEDKRIHAALQEYLDERKTIAEKKKMIFNLTQPLFLSQKGIAFSNKTLQKRFEHLYRISGIRGGSSHSGRRSFATQLIEQGVDIKAVATLMGHKNIANTAKYVQDNPDRLKRIANMSLSFL